MVATTTATALPLRPQACGGRRLRGRREIADYLGIHPETVDLWRRRPRDPLPTHRPGREVEAIMDEIDEWVRRH